MPAGHTDPVRDRALAAEADLVSRYDAALALPSVAADSTLTAKLTAIRAEHAAHAAAIKQGYTPPSTPTPTPSSGSGAPPATTDAKSTVAALAGAEQNAASKRTADILAADGTTAMLLASIAAAESGHAALLQGGSA
ncbi:hypothetical protein [Catenulispora sp. GP43]|uniref:hypothetical protein n=1 Tax=Catenulispora sp. GP43 TaxID=3156263 RepID=UPI003516913C